jgi:hypothetical protein
MTLTRRKLIGGLGLLIAAPAIVRASSIMKVKVYRDLSHLEGANVSILSNMVQSGRIYTMYNTFPPTKWLAPDELIGGNTFYSNCVWMPDNFRPELSTKERLTLYLQSPTAAGESAA